LPDAFSPWQKNYLEALSDCTFGNFTVSNKNIDIILKTYSGQLPDSLYAELYLSKAYNHINLHEYNKALKAYEILKNNYYKYLTKEEIDYYNDDYDLYTCIKDYPAQRISKSSDTEIKIEKDMAGMLNIPLKVCGKDYKFVYDTGANFSVIVESEAIKLGLKLSDKTVKLSTSTEEKTNARLALADTLIIGKIKVFNVVFLVLKDENLTFGPYKITGIIGNPVIRAFEEVSITKDNEMIIPLNPTNNSLRNLAMDGFTPVIQVIYGTDSLAFVFDSGAMTTTLFEPFLIKYKNNIEGKYSLTTINLGGAGGMHAYKGYVMDNVNLSSGNSSVLLNKVDLLAERTNFEDKEYFGRLGQDYINQFNTVVYCYANMYIEFKK
jgi:predicted aspartyl protease